MIPMNINEINGFEIVSVNNKPYMFTNMRIDRESLPKGFVAYDVRDGDCDGRFAQINKYVWVNHWGTIIGIDPILLDEFFGYIPEDDKNDGSFIDGYVVDTTEFINNYDYFLNQCI